MTKFHFREKTVIDAIYHRFIYLHRSVKNCESVQKNLAEQISRDGFVLLENYIADETLKNFQDKIESKFQAGDFSYPVLAQSKIDQKKHKTLIDNFLLGTGEEFLKQGIAFDSKDFTNYRDVLKKYEPSTLGFNIPSKDFDFFNLWLDPFLMGVIEEYLGYSPYLFEAYVRRNFPSPYRTMNHFWHRDLNDKFHLLKVFIFFTDTDLENGPHEYIKGSHKDFELNDKRYFNDQDVLQKYPESSGRLIRSKVKAGSVLIEDTRGLHKAALPLKGYRDLGYAVFMPFPWFRQYKFVNYQIEAATAARLSETQRRYIPKSFIS